MRSKVERHTREAEKASWHSLCGSYRRSERCLTSRNCGLDVGGQERGPRTQMNQLFWARPRCAAGPLR